ncbi:hypothetical protein LTR84_004144 [Exophiala bonariae]|uniref:Uncharacterized protein n=1 Tax=Exophiala bonariae TaxID=1690606 RepID=A0AAV9N9J4_9EURO|nr:hypothetical protein LTR84_004144 [Exophiala bonariae]
MYLITTISLFVLSMLGFTSATPIVRKSLNPKFLQARSPLATAAFASDWPTNVIMLGGSQSYGLYIPVDGTWYDFENIQCLGLPAYAIGDCNDITVDNIGVVAGNGPCSFVGNAGWAGTLQGNAGEGYYTVGPPQTIIRGKCGNLT